VVTGCRGFVSTRSRSPTPSAVARKARYAFRVLDEIRVEPATGLCGHVGSRNMKKVLKVGGSLLAGVLVLTLFTLRLTGLEPQYLEAKDLPAHNMIARPGLWLRGEVVTTPVRDWSFVNELEHPGRNTNTILVETRTPYFIPHSVRVVPFVRNGQLYIHSYQDRMGVEFPKDKAWTSNVARDPRVRLKIGGKLYEMTVVLIADRAEAAAVLGRDPETRVKGPDGREHVTGYTHVYGAFQRNIPEFGGTEP
jgi:hypothetical protein